MAKRVLVGLLVLLAACVEAPLAVTALDAATEDLPLNAEAGNSSYSRTVRADAPVAYWRFEERSGTVACDCSGNNHHGTYVDGPVLGADVGASRTGKGMSLQSSTDGMRVEYGPWTDMSALTVEAWVKPDRVTAREGIILVDKGFTWNLFIDPDGYPAFQYPGDIPPETISPTPLVVGETYYLVGTIQDGVMKLYVNGELVDEAEVSAIPPNEQPIHVGRGVGAVRFEFYGVIDDVAVYDRALSAETIVGHYEAGR